jgi:transposase
MTHYIVPAHYSDLPRTQAHTTPRASKILLASLHRRRIVVFKRDLIIPSLQPWLLRKMHLPPRSQSPRSHGCAILRRREAAHIFRVPEPYNPRAVFSASVRNEVHITCRRCCTAIHRTQQKNATDARRLHAMSTWCKSKQHPYCPSDCSNAPYAPSSNPFHCFISTFLTCSTLP